MENTKKSKNRIGALYKACDLVEIAMLKGDTGIL